MMNIVKFKNTMCIHMINNIFGVTELVFWGSCDKSLEPETLTNEFSGLFKHT